MSSELYGIGPMAGRNRQSETPYESSWPAPELFADARRNVPRTLHWTCFKDFWHNRPEPTRTHHGPPFLFERPGFRALIFPDFIHVIDVCPEHAGPEYARPDVRRSSKSNDWTHPPDGH